MARDSAYWQRVILPALTGLASDALGVTVVHSACVDRDGDGLLLAGESGAGKSTLSLAMARRGFAFLSDDWTYLSHAGGQLAAWGLVTPLKLLPEATQFFPELRGTEPGVSLNGERAFEIDPERLMDARRSLHCEPRWLVFLERHDKPGHTLIRMPPHEAARRLGSAQGRLPAELASHRKIQRATIRSLVERECWLLRYGGTPEATAQVLDRFCAVSRHEDRNLVVGRHRLLFQRSGPDPTGRLTSTPLAANVAAAGCTVRFETNSPAILRLVVDSLPRAQGVPPVGPRFGWRLVIDADSKPNPHRPHISRVSADGMQLVNVGQSSFLATDAAAGCAVGFVAGDLVKDESYFRNSVLARLISMTAAALAWKPPLPSRGKKVPRLT